MPEHPPSRTEGTNGLPWYVPCPATPSLSIVTCTTSTQMLINHTVLRLIGAIAVVLPTTFWLLSSGQKADKHNDHEQQKALRSSHPGILNTPHKDIETKADGLESDLPEDAPNRPDNREKVC